ncbi:hypothetical protein EST38_g4036 [Candolleomyces aberdarensis]|uniref:Transcriptional adapter 3 n=1 Tax=Candolleomyces aberdarensis TaxID=2316362 RepID=A0A4Q2DQT9_9AGAR|nr:hypothetical protein EST38_g4036 [Candolleomyces aberdarensis]
MSSVPSIEELEQLHSELKLLRQSAVARGKKASDDLRTIQDLMRRLKEKEKGKAKAVDKIHQYQQRTLAMYIYLDPNHGWAPIRYHHQHAPPSIRGVPHTTTKKCLRSGSMSKSIQGKVMETILNVPARAPQLWEASLQPLYLRKYINLSFPRHRPIPRFVLYPHNEASLSQQLPPPAPPSSQVSSGPDWTISETQVLLPPRPPIPPPPQPGPSRPIDITTDFSKMKPPAQTGISTFYSSVEPYLRPISEEDLGFLEYTGDEVEPFVMPKLGVHYLELWEEQDAGGYPNVHKTKEAPASAFVAPKPTWDPSTLMEQDLITEEKGHGPLTERVISALLPIPDLGWKGVKAAEDAMEGRPGGSGAAAARRERLNVSDLENRIRDTMRYHGLLDSVPDFSEKVDDPIATALRQAQAELRVVLATNKARKERLAAIARDRLGYQEYLESRDALDRNITALYAKLQKKDVPKLSKKKKKPLAGAAAASAAAAAANAEALENGSGPPPPCPAALGLTPDEDLNLTVSDQLKTYVETRMQWVKEVGSVFDELQKANPGRIWGFPMESVYKGIDEEVREKLAKENIMTGGSGGSGSPMKVDPKGKGRVVDSDAMDIG